jgi:hypothetical protein
MGPFHRTLGLAQLSFGLPTLGLEHFSVHLRKNLSGGDKVAFINENVLDAARRLGGDVDLHRLNATVTARETVTQLFRLEIAPGQKDETGRDHHESDPQEPLPVLLTHAHARTYHKIIGTMKTTYRQVTMKIVTQAGD